MDQKKKQGNPWSGNSAEDLNMKTQKERTFSVNLPSCYTAKDVLKAVRKNVGNAEIDTVAKQSFQGYWTIITKSTQGAKILLDLEDLYMADDEGYRLIPRINRATLLTLPFVDPEIRNGEIRDYFKMYGTVKNVAYEYYRDLEFGNVKTGRRLVFIDLYEDHGVPPFCIVRGQKISVSYRGRRPICFHCNVEGHTKAKCPIAKFKTCYNCGAPTHEHVECWEPTFVAYFFKDNKTYPPFCYPTDYESEDPEDETVYGLVQNIDEARAYNLTFDPYFYSPDAAERYRRSTYDDTEQDQGNEKDEHDENDENIRGIWESDDEDTTEPSKTTEHMETDSKEPPTQQDTEKTDSTEKPKTKPAQKTTPSSKQPSTQPPNASDPGASKESPDLSPPSQPTAPQKPETHKKDSQTAPKRKITTNSPKVEQKKTKDATAANKASATKEPTVIINGKACVQRNLDFSGSQPHSKIPVSKQVRAGRAPGNRGTSSDARPRERSRSRHRETGSAEGREQDSCLL